MATTLMQTQQNDRLLLRLTIIRHGETTANSAGIIQGQSLDPSYKLTDLGVSQAQAAAEVLKMRKFWKVFCSDLPRCRETASYLFEHEQINGDNSEVPRTLIEYSQLLREASAGLREGRPKHILEEELIAEFVAEYGTAVEVPISETRAEVVKRGQAMVRHISQLAKQEDSDEALDVLIVTHGGFIQSFLKSVCGIKGVKVVNNTSFSYVNVLTAGNHLMFEAGPINDVTHLDGSDSLMSSSKW